SQCPFGFLLKLAPFSFFQHGLSGFHVEGCYAGFCPALSKERGREARKKKEKKKGKKRGLTSLMVGEVSEGHRHLRRPQPLLSPRYRRKRKMTPLPLLAPAAAARAAAVAAALLHRLCHPWLGPRRAGREEEEGGRAPPLPLLCLVQRPTEGRRRTKKGKKKKEKKKKIARS
ncbi:hypothetical protein Taro_004106, partial [Colocasia esculenta]|nr:hypothetical protein [Colocasia esculenta]